MLGHRRRVEHHDELGRHGSEHRHLVLLDEGYGLLGRELRCEDGGDAEKRRRDVAAPDPEAVRSRDDAHEDVRIVQLARLHHKAVEAQPPLLIVPDTLGQSGGARGEIEKKEIAGHQAPFFSAGAVSIQSGKIDGRAVDGNNPAVAEIVFDYDVVAQVDAARSQLPHEF